MRIGHNPHKDKAQIASDYFHQIVIPVYIPNQEGYFKDGFEILKICLQSLFATIHSKTYVTIVNNGSCNLVVDYLNELHRQNKIQEIIHVTNIGYINAMLKGIAGQKFSLITTSDADVFFLNGWQSETYTIFESFPKAGAVCPTPSSRSLRNHTANIYWDNLFNKKIQFNHVVNPEALKKFGLSVGNADFYNAIQLKKYLTLTSKKCKAVIGAGHFIVTYRSSIFDKLEKRYTDYVLGGNSDDLFDLPVVKKGFWRLSTIDNFAYHMGNVMEDWMHDEVSKLSQGNKNIDYNIKQITSKSNLSYFIKSKVFGKFILNKKILRCFLFFKGLTWNESKNYLS
ncbi:glycosyltransferase family A protein [Flavobacterium defluvii]|uniref:Glycosyl transferase family 2 n=1 Tax=Flavobacterium defluvii TaxID=370979 RepID=A0A1M5NVL3_9FLAO|nr:glycosyltransferase family A protein [Flavobacterium defluvii]SHG93023.1 Glycosyl transferase family 2 [Flavobacterium defluvii]